MGYRLLENNIHVLNVNTSGDLRILKYDLKDIIIYHDEDFIKLLELVNTKRNTEYVVNEGIRLFNNIKTKYSGFLIYDDIVAFDSNIGFQTVNTIKSQSEIKPSRLYLESRLEYPNDPIFTIEPYTQYEKSDFTLVGLIKLIKITFINYEHRQLIGEIDGTKNLFQNFIGGDYNDCSTQRIFLNNRIEVEIITNYGYGFISYLVCSFYIDGKKIIEDDRFISYQNDREPKKLEYTKDFTVKDYNTILEVFRYIVEEYIIIKQRLELNKKLTI